MIEVSEIKIKFNFTDPWIVSRDAKDSIHVQIEPGMFKEQVEFSNFSSEQLMIVESEKENFAANLIVQSPESQELIDTVKKVTEVTEDGLKAFFSANIVGSFFMAGML